MNDKIVKIEFNVWANDESEGDALCKAICNFVDWHGSQGRKVSASKLLEAMNRWQDNPLIRNAVINHFR